jgi:hypothetical protein
MGIRRRLGRQPGTEKQGHCSPERHTADSLRLGGLPGRLDEPIQRIRERPERERRWLSSEVWQKGTESRVSDPRLVVTSLRRSSTVSICDDLLRPGRDGRPDQALLCNAPPHAAQRRAC